MSDYKNNNVISLEDVRKRKAADHTVAVTVIEKMYMVDGKIKCEVSGKRPIPKSMLDKE